MGGLEVRLSKILRASTREDLLRMDADTFDYCYRYGSKEVRSLASAILEERKTRTIPTLIDSQPHLPESINLLTAEFLKHESLPFICRHCGRSLTLEDVLQGNGGCPVCGEHETIFTLDTVVTYIVDTAKYINKQQEKINRLTETNRLLKEEIKRLQGWLQYIDGGDHPCTDAEQLRKWAYEAVTLGHTVPK